VQPYHKLSLPECGKDAGLCLLQGQAIAVEDLRLQPIKQGGIDQGAGVDHQICLREQPLALDRYQLRITRSGTHEVDLHAHQPLRLLARRTEK